MTQTPQPVLTPLTNSAIFLVATINQGGAAAAHDLMADLTGLQRAVGFRIPDGRLASVVGIGSDAWDRLFSGPRPAKLHPFRELNGPRHHACRRPRAICSFTSAPPRWTCASSSRRRSRPGSAMSRR